MHKLGAALVVAVVLALCASMWAVLEVRGYAVRVKELHDEDVATIGLLHELSLQVESAARHARMVLVTGDAVHVDKLAQARAAGLRKAAVLDPRLASEKERELLARGRVLAGVAAREMDRAVEIMRAGDARSASVQVLERVEPLREQLADVLTQLGVQRRAELARRTAQYSQAVDDTVLLSGVLGALLLACSVLLAALLIQTTQRANQSEARLRHIFQGAAVAILEEDYKQVGTALDALKASGVRDLDAYLEQHPERQQELLALVDICSINPAMAELIELEPGRELRSLVPLFLPETMPVFRDALRVLWRGERQHQGETILQSLSGKRIEALLKLSFPVDVQRAPVVVTLTDVSARKEEERRKREVLERSEARLRAVFDQCPVGITMSDVAGRMVYMNPTAQRLIQPGGVELGSRGVDFLAPEDRDRVEQWRADFLSGRTTVSDLTMTIPAPGAAPQTLRVQANVLREGDEVRGLVSTVEDVTEQLRLEEQLRQVQKMEAVGQLAGGVAHDFNNLLTVILNGASLLQTGASREQALLLDQVEAAAERAASLTAQLLAFGRKQLLRPRVVDLNELVENHCRMLRRLVGEKVQIEAKLDPDGLPAEVDPNLIELLLMNLVVNARDAMPLGGQITIALESVVTDAEQGAQVRLSVKDSGIGIAPAHLPHVFEPFFTTKAVGKGTGLGLATVYGIVEQHHGRIAVESEPGQGTTFHVYLPRADAAVVPQRESIHPTPEGHETLLLVEDEAAVRQMVATSLKRCGYQVIEAENGDDALVIWRARGEEVDLLLTDMVMPGSLSGRELALQLRSERPELKVVYMSGYGAHDLAGEPWSILVQKPFQLSTLAQALRARLDEKQPSMRPKSLVTETGAQQRVLFLA